MLEAKQLCSVCPVLGECAEWELAQSDWVPGVIAGRDEMERSKRMRNDAPTVDGRAASRLRRIARNAVRPAKRESYQRVDDVGTLPELSHCFAGGRSQQTDLRKMIALRSIGGSTGTARNEHD